MARSKSFFGKRKGSAGDFTYSVRHGVQVTRERVTDVENPRTQAQMIQRMMFASAGLFYKHANQKFFRFGFEEKRKNESDYNAFMRYNVRRACAMSKFMIENDYPALGEWMLTNGRLGFYQPEVVATPESSALGFPAIVVDFSSTGRVADGGDVSAEREGAGVGTVGDYGRALLANNSNLMEGDVVTLVRIWSPYLLPIGTVDEAISEQTLVGVRDTDPNPRWSLVQEKISLSSTADSSVFTTVETSNGMVLCLRSPDGVSINRNECLYACALVISRPMADGRVFVTTSVIGCDTRTKAAVEVGMGERWKEWVARNYVEVREGWSQDSVLKGSLLPSGPMAVGPVDGIDEPVASVDVAFAGSSATSLRFNAELGGSYDVSSMRLVFSPVVGAIVELPYSSVVTDGPISGNDRCAVFTSGSFTVFVYGLTGSEGSWNTSGGDIVCLGGTNGQSVVGCLEFFVDD